MVATPVAAVNRYINPGVTRIVFATSIANISGPTRAEINAGQDVSRWVAASEGWAVNSEQVDTPNMAETFTSKIGGKTSAEDSSLTCYADIAGVDARDLWPRGTTGFILWMDGGDVAGRDMDVYPVLVISQPKQRDPEGGSAARIMIQFSITAQPAENVTVPAA